MHTKRFELSDIKKVPITLSEQAKAIIDASNQQGRLLPQSLSEHFGAMGTIERVCIDVVSQENSTLLSILVEDKYTESKQTYLINSADINALHEVTRIPIVQARSVAQELVRLHKA